MEARLSKPPAEKRSDVTHGRLTNREFEVLDLLNKGLTIKQIAQVMGIAPSTVRTHYRAIKWTIR